MVAEDRVSGKYNLYFPLCMVYYEFPEGTGLIYPLTLTAPKEREFVLTLTLQT